jgi:hypothetical protein
MLITVDICDCEKEPVVLHGKTFTTKVDLCLALQAIMKCTFAASPYPIIIAAEIRCSLPQQDDMANIMLGIHWFAHLLMAKQTEVLPSLEDLQDRILLNVRFLLDYAYKTILTLLNISPHKPIQDISVSIAAKSSLTKMSASSGTTTWLTRVTSSTFSRFLNLRKLSAC